MRNANEWALIETSLKDTEMKMVLYSLLVGLLFLLVGSFFYFFVLRAGEQVPEPQPLAVAPIPTQDVDGDANFNEPTIERQSEERFISSDSHQESTNGANDGVIETNPETTASASDRTIEELTSDFGNAIAQYNAQLDQAPPSLSSSTPTITELTQIDEVFQQLLRTYLASGRTPVEARRELSTHVGWVEIPRALGLGGKAEVSLDMPGYETESLKGEYDTKPLVLWRDVPRKEGGTMMVCQGAYVVANSTKRFRVRMNPYSVFESQGNLELTYLCGEEIGPWYPGNSGMFIDAYDVGKSLPVVGLLAGPAGNAGGLRFYANRYEQEKGAWVLWEGDEWDEVSAWEYSATSKILTVYRHDKLIGDYYESILNVADRVEKHLE